MVLTEPSATVHAVNNEDAARPPGRLSEQPGKRAHVSAVTVVSGRRVLQDNRGLTAPPAEVRERPRPESSPLSRTEVRGVGPGRDHAFTLTCLPSTSLPLRCDSQSSVLAQALRTALEHPPTWGNPREEEV